MECQKPFVSRYIIAGLVKFFQTFCHGNDRKTHFSIVHKDFRRLSAHLSGFPCNSLLEVYTMRYFLHNACSNHVFLDLYIAI
jgi:hypothetical protein